VLSPAMLQPPQRMMRMPDFKRCLLQCPDCLSACRLQRGHKLPHRCPSCGGRWYHIKEEVHEFIYIAM